jgi:glycine cleavage system transcriptional repressor
MQERQYLSVIMLGPNNTEILKTVSHLIAQHGCQMVNGHAVTQGELYSFSFLLAGDWSAIAKMEAKLNTLGRKFPFQVFLKRTELHVPEKPLLPYVLYITSLDNPDNFHQLMRFLHQQSVSITEIFIDAYKPKNTVTAMTAIIVKIQLAADISISDWRERFMLFCDDMNFDAIMEPEKP